LSAVLAAEINVYPLKIDWGRLMREMRAAQWTPYKVALTLGADHATAYSWEKGCEPSYSYGAALLSLHRSVCGLISSEKLHSDAKPRA
jgi:hypothetical protein